MNDPFAMPDLALEDRVQALEMNLIAALARIRVLEMRSMQTARSGDADTGRAGDAVIDTPRESAQRLEVGPEGIPGWIAPFEAPTPPSVQGLPKDSVVVTGPCPRPPTRVVHTGGVSVWVYFDLFCFYGGGAGGPWVAHKQPTQLERVLFDALVPAWQSVGVEFYSSEPMTDMHGFPAPPPWTAPSNPDAAAIVAAATTGVATAGSQDDNRVTRKAIQAPSGYDLGEPCPGEKCGGRGRIHDAERWCIECSGR